MSSEKSVSKLVRDWLDRDPSLVHSLQNRTTAQRDVAKQLMNQLIDSESFSDKNKSQLEGNIAVAITRYLKRLRLQQEEMLGVKRVHDILKKGTTEVSDGLKHYKINLQESLDKQELLMTVLAHLENNISSALLNKGSIELYVSKMAENDFLSNLKVLNNAPLKLQDSLSLLRLILPKEATGIPGVLAHVSSLLADQAISIYDTLIYHSDQLILTFVINEINASKARDILLKLNNNTNDTRLSTKP